MLFCLLITFQIYGQQSNTLYFMHSIPQSNLVNPAVQNECRLFIGLPAISSFHINIANNGFTFNQLIDNQSPGEYTIDAATLLDKLGNRNYFSTELYACIFAFGIKLKNRYYFTLNIRERDDLNVLYTKDLFSLAYKGNTQYEGQFVSLKGNGLQFNHFREFSIGISKAANEYTTYGIRAKLLFGKLNFSTTRNNVSLLTEENTFNLLFNGDVKFDASLPASLDYVDGNTLRANRNYYNNSLNDLIFNRKNYGFAIDIGIINKYSQNVILTGSILDLGFISYRSNLTNYSLEGAYAYTGPLNDTIQSYFLNIFDQLNDTLQISLNRRQYISFLYPRIYAGLSYVYNKNFTFNILLFSHIIKEKVQSGLTLSANWRPSKQFGASLSWSAIHRSINNIGAGFFIGRNPVQFYLVSDNVVGMIWPQSTKNLNLRFGLNIILGCENKPTGNKSNMNDCGCYWLRKAEERKERKKKFMRK